MKLASPRSLFGAFVRRPRSLWYTITPSAVEQNHSKINRREFNIYWGTGSKSRDYLVDLIFIPNFGIKSSTFQPDNL